MKNEQGFSLVELLIVVAIIAIIAAIAVPSLLTARMAANESAGIQGCRTAGSAEIAFAATNNQNYVDIATLISSNFLDSRSTNGIDGYVYTDAAVTVDGVTNGGTAYSAAVAAGSPEFGIIGTPNTGMGRYIYGIGPDQVVRYQGAIGSYADPVGVAAGDGIGLVAASGGGGS